MTFLNEGDLLQVGDIIHATHPTFGLKRHHVHRVTKCYAFVKWNDLAEGKFPIQYNYRFESFPREQYCQTRYKVERRSENK
jgi:hypothetical protein